MIPRTLRAAILGTPRGNTEPTPAWESDFRALTLGDPGTLPGGLSFSRAGAGRSVQTSANTIMLDTGKNFAGDNFPRCGQPRGAASRGIALESLSNNVAANNFYADPNNVASDLRDVSNATAFNGAAGGSVTYSAGTGSPDGVATARRVQATSGSTGRYRGQLNAVGGSSGNIAWPALCYSTWQKSAGQVQQAIGVYDGATQIYVATARTLSGAWERVVTKHTGIGSTYNDNRFAFPVLANDQTAAGGVGAAARDCEVDCIQIEERRFASSWIPPNSVSRARERLWHPTRTTQIIGGRLCVELTVCPMGSSTDYQDERQNTSGGTQYSVAEQHLWYLAADDRGWFDPVTQKITSRVDGVDYVHNTALAWNLGDTIQIWIECGNGVPKAAYRVSTNDEVSWGAAVQLGTGSAQAALPSGAGTLDFLGRGTASEDVFSVWLKSIRVFDNARPGWAA